MKGQCTVLRQDENIIELDCKFEGAIGRKKRSPSAYNIFMGKCIKGKSGAIQTRFRECALEYKKQK